MGLLGQITARILQANGCHVFAIDPRLLEVEIELGGLLRNSNSAAFADFDLKDRILAWTRGRGADAVTLTASTSSDQPISLAGDFCRERGRVIIVGSVGTKFPREPYYMKELDIRIARSYGPGRYDPSYEDLGLDYPVGYVRFTEQRNMEAFLDLLASRKVDLTPLITHRFSILEAKQAFDLLSANPEDAPENTRYLGIVLNFQNQPGPEGPGDPRSGRGLDPVPLSGGDPPRAEARGLPRLDDPAKHDVMSPDTALGISGGPKDVGFIGLGNYATSQIIGRLKKFPDLKLKAVSTASGMAAALKGTQYGFELIAPTAETVLESRDLGTVFILSRHDSHARFVKSGLRAGKHVFVEKPLCLTSSELQEIQVAYQESKGVLMVGFNRRFSPLVLEIKNQFPRGFQHLVYRINAGPLPKDHWLKLPEIGGGRILGECCHFIDLAAFLSASEISSVSAHRLGGDSTISPATSEDVHVHLTMNNGAVASVIYLSTGSSFISKEYIEVHGLGKSAILSDFNQLTISGAKTRKLPVQDKGQEQMLHQWMKACESGNRENSPILPSSLWNSTSATLAVIDSLASGKTIYLNGN
jgi:polar amino acid transport system substrate-binding protein